MQVIAQEDNIPSKKDKKESSEEQAPPVLGDIFKPTIGLGVGTLSYFGNIYHKNTLQPVTQSRIGYELNLSQPLNKYLYFNFYVMFGKLGANEHSSIPDLNKNFESQIRLGGIQLLYDFSNLIKKQNHIRPYISTGFEGFEFLSKTDLYDRHGNKYYYWTDGTIRNMAQNSPGSQNATTLVRDYSYDSDIRELNQNGYGKYQERSWAVPLGVGFITNMGEHLKFKLGATMHFTFTNKIDGVGSTKNDKFLMVSASVHYDLVTRKKEGGLDTLPSDHYEGVDFLAIDNGDEDGDGVKDFDDLCHGTPEGVKVDSKGCPLDDDKDHIPDYRDDEIPTPDSLHADGQGVGYNTEMAQDWYDRYYDSTGASSKVVILDTVPKEGQLAKPVKGHKEYTVELVRYQGGIPEDEMAYLLSIGDVKSFNIGDTTVVYAAGSYEDIRNAIRRRDEFRNEGLKSARVGYFKNGEYYIENDTEQQKDLSAAQQKYGATANTPSSSNVSGGVSSGQVVYRVQLGAYRNKLSPDVFKNAGKVLELKSDNGYYTYSSGSFKTIQDAASHKADLIYEGYEDAFISAYKGGKRVALKDVGATYEAENKDYKENLSETAGGSIIDKNLVKFRVQIAFVKADDTSYDELTRDLQDVERQPTISGKIRIVSGNFTSYNDAVKYKNTLVEKGLSGAFVVAFFKGENISLQEAFELLK